MDNGQYAKIKYNKGVKDCKWDPQKIAEQTFILDATLHFILQFIRMSID